MQVLEKQVELRPEPTEVRRARRWVRSQLAGLGPAQEEAQADTLVLLVSELVTNAVVHTGRPAVLRLAVPVPPWPPGMPPVTGVPVRLEVADASSSVPLRRRAEGEDTGGRGLELVEILADRWGWQPREGGGKHVWCELDCAVPAAPWPGGRRVPAGF